MVTVPAEGIPRSNLAYVSPQTHAKLGCQLWNSGLGLNSSESHPVEWPLRQALVPKKQVLILEGGPGILNFRGAMPDWMLTLEDGFEARGIFKLQKEPTKGPINEGPSSPQGEC